MVKPPSRPRARILSRSPETPEPASRPRTKAPTRLTARVPVGKAESIRELSPSARKRVLSGKARCLQELGDFEAALATHKQVIADNPDPVEQFKQGKETIIKFLVGQVMRATKGKANPQAVNDIEPAPVLAMAAPPELPVAELPEPELPEPELPERELPEPVLTVAGAVVVVPSGGAVVGGAS